MTKIPAHPKFCDGSARLPRPGSLLSAWLGRFVLSTNFSTRCVIWTSRHRGISVAPAAGDPWEASHPDLRVLQRLGALNDEPRDPTPKSNATSCSCWVRSSQRFIDCQVRIQVSCCGGGTDQPPPVLPSPVLPGPVLCCWLLLVDRSSSFITAVEAGLFRAACWDPIRGARSRVGGAGRGPLILRPLESSIARACVQRPAPEGVRGHTGHRSRSDPSWESRKRVLNPTFISATPFSTQGVWTIAPLQKTIRVT